MTDFEIDLTYEFKREVLELARRMNWSLINTLHVQASKAKSFFVKKQTLLEELQVWGGLTKEGAQLVFEHVREKGCDGTLFGILKTFYDAQLCDKTPLTIHFSQERVRQFLGCEKTPVQLSITTGVMYPADCWFAAFPAKTAESIVLNGIEFDGGEMHQLDMYRTGRGLYLCSDVNYALDVARAYHHNRKDLVIVAFQPFSFYYKNGENWMDLSKKELLGKIGRVKKTSDIEYILGPGITYHFNWIRKAPKTISMLYIHSHSLANIVEACVLPTLCLTF